jgi:methionine synthase reductase
MESSS